MRRRRTPPHRRVVRWRHIRPSIDWGNELVPSSLLDSQGLGYQCGLRPDHLRATGPLHRVGTPVLAYLRRLLQGAGKRSGLGHVRGPAAVGDRLGAHRRSCSATTQRPVLGAADRVPGSGCGRRTGHGIPVFTDSGSRSRSSRSSRPFTSARYMLDLYLTQRFIIRWRVWLTDRLTADWLDRPGLLPRAVHRPHHRQSRSAHPAGHRHLHHRRTARPNTPNYSTREHVAVRCGQRRGVGDLVRRDPVEPVGAADAPRLHAAQGAVLDRHRLRADRDRGRVLDRPAADPAELPSTSCPTPRSATPWCGCATPPRRSASTAASAPSGRSCPSGSTTSSPTTAAT